jgi:hypothetical protein
VAPQEQSQEEAKERSAAVEKRIDDFVDGYAAFVARLLIDGKLDQVRDQNREKAS